MVAFIPSKNTAAGQVKRKAQFRHILDTVERTLDATDLLDDNYLNLVDWSTRNVLSVALTNTVYLWDSTSSSIAKLLTPEENGALTTVWWARDGRYMAGGLKDAYVQFWNSQKLRQFRSLGGHSACVGVGQFSATAVVTTLSGTKWTWYG